MISYKYRLYRSKKEKTLERMMCEAAFVWNHAIALQRRYYSVAKTLGWTRRYIPSARMQHHMARRYKPTRLNSQTVQEILQRLDTSYKLFFNRVTRRPPKMRPGKDFSSFVFKQTGYKLYGNEFIINKVSKRFKFAKSREWEGRVKIVRVFRSQGKWYILVITDAKAKQCGKSHTGASAGIDFGLKTYMTFSNGTRIEAPQFQRQLLNDIRRYHRRMSQAQRGSNHWRAAKRRLNATFATLKDRRTDWNYQTAHALCRKYEYIFVEDLNLAGMMAHKHWGRKISDLGFASFLNTLEYVASKYGTTVHKVNRFFASSRLCECGYKNDTLTLREREWTCPVCGLHHDRDLNAARNIYRRGVADLESTSKTVPCTA